MKKTPPSPEKSQTRQTLTAGLLGFGLVALGATSGCINTGGDKTTAALANASKANTSGASKTSFSIYNATFEVVGPSGATGATGASGAAPTHVDLLLNANSSAALNGATLNSVCVKDGDATKACSCRFTWDEQNLSDSSRVTRTSDTSPDQITSFEMRCPLPTPWVNSEIFDNTQVTVQIIPNTTAGSTQSFSSNGIVVTKTPLTSQGDFRDVEGRSFKNIFHYVCYNRVNKNMGVFHDSLQLSSTANSNATVFASIANNFALGSVAPTGQSYYFDFYIRNSELGSPNASAPGFVCPTTTINGTQSFFPMDTTYALALNSSADFPIQVNANTVVPLNEQQKIVGTIGFAAKPLSDGTCPSFMDSKGFTRRTFRLRKYTTAYPLRYNADGDTRDLSQQINTVYVLDRPVNKVSIGSDKPITRLGPKPCPFSFATAQFGQRCMSDASLTGWSIDGDQVDGNARCPIFPPVPSSLQKADGTLVIRPYKAFVPRYLEDTTFQACAFQSSNPVDPEIVLSTDTTIFPGPAGPFDFWCAKHYPPADPNPLNRAPGECSTADTAAAIKTDKSYSCSLSFNPSNSARQTPQAGCCQVCAGTDCSSVGAGTTPAGRNAAYSPPQNTGNPAQGIKKLQRGTPNVSANSCFDPSED